MSTNAEIIHEHTLAIQVESFKYVIALLEQLPVETVIKELKAQVKAKS